jgi:hypothetical protein
VDSTAEAGAFDLDVELLSDTCPARELEQGNATITSTDPDVLSSSCSPAGASLFGRPEGLPEHSMPLEVDLPPSAACTYFFQSDLPFVVYVLQGATCAGPELRCTEAMRSGDNYETSLSFNATQNGDYVVVVESLQPGLDVEYTMYVACVA